VEVTVNRFTASCVAATLAVSLLLSVVAVAQENQAPDATAVSASTDENVAVDVTLQGADADGDNLRFSILQNPSNGAVSCGFSAGCTNYYAFNYDKNADTDDGSCQYASCRQIKLGNPGATTGDRVIDPDGVGPRGAITVRCDMTTDGGGYTYFPIESGARTYRSTDHNSCLDRGLQIAVPKSKNHFRAMIATYGSGYFAVVPGVFKSTSGGNYTGYAMNSDSVPEWQSVDGGRWWVRDFTYSEPNGDYHANCWLSMYDWNVDNLRFNDGNCNYSTTRYVCSTNDKEGPENLTGDPESCADILRADPNTGSGNQVINPKGAGRITVYCDMTTDGGGYDYYGIANGIRTYRSTDGNSCKDIGMDIVVPRTKAHWTALLSRFGIDYFNTIPGVSKPTGGGNYTGYAMKSGSVPDWRASDGGSWWIRDSTYSEPNGDYQANCWLLQYDWNVNNIRFNDGTCSYSTTRYVCSTNAKDGPVASDGGDFVSCDAIKEAEPSSPSGEYGIRTETGVTRVYCDMDTDGGGYDYYPVLAGRRTYRSSDPNSCQDVGLQMVVPRTKAHWAAMLNRYGHTYFSVLPGISKSRNGGNYTSYAFNSHSVPDWTAQDGGQWWVRNTPYSEPNGDYNANCWLSQYDWDVNNIRFNDGSCSYSTTRYICSTNAKRGYVGSDPGSCAEILRANPNAASGQYTINPGGFGAVVVDCDMTTDGGGYTYKAIPSGRRTYRTTDHNSCKELGMDIVVPRTKAHWVEMLRLYGSTYFPVVPGLSKPNNGGNYTSYAMKWGSVPDWRASDGGRWWLRDSPYSEPNGDYHGNCWLNMYDWNPNAFRFNDLNCNYSATRYVCSTNDKDGTLTPHDGKYASCLELKNNEEGVATGWYQIQPQPGTLVQAYCDMTTDGGGYTMVPVDSGLRTHRASDPNSCREMGMEMVVPRSKEHWRSMLTTFGNTFFTTVPGITKRADGTNYTRFPMKSGSVPHWEAIDGGSWWLRDTTYSQPNGNYSGGCWLSLYHHDVNELRFDDNYCHFGTNRYVCSTNDKDGIIQETPQSCAEILLGDPSSTSRNYVINPKGRGDITVFCDMTTDGGGYDYYPVSNGIRTYRSRERNSCHDVGLEMVVPRTKEHWRAMLTKYGGGYFEAVPGVSKPYSGGNYSGYAMNSRTVPDWRAVDGGSWWIRDTPYGEPNGNYHEDCWLRLYSHDVNNLTFDDADCRFSTASYICSTNTKDGDLFAPRSCVEILEKDPAARSGLYTINPGKGNVRAYCDMTTDGGGYTMFGVGAGLTTYRRRDQDTCDALGMDIVVPKSKGHWRSLLARFGTSYFRNIPGVLKAWDGGNYTTYAMNSLAVPDWSAVDGHSWWLRDSSYTEPNGDYQRDCWLLQYDWNVDNIRFNDGNCSYPMNRYVCSTNDKDPIPKYAYVEAGARRAANNSNRQEGGGQRTTKVCRYTPRQDFYGTDTFRYRVTDTAGATGDNTVTITVRNVNRAPTANNQTVGTNEDTAVSFTLSGSDPDGDNLTFAVIADPGKGSVSCNGASCTYTPSPNVHGTDTIGWRVTDTSNVSADATATITIASVNDPPTAASRAASTNEDTAVAITVAAADIDGDNLQWDLLVAPGRGVLSGNLPNVTYTPTSNLYGQDTFQFRVRDTSNAASNTATVTISVAAVNDAPVAQNATVTGQEDATTSFTLPASDVDGDTLTYAVVSQPANGSLSCTANSCTFTPRANFNGSTSMAFRAADRSTNSNTATITIVINPVNDPPTANPLTITTPEDTPKDFVLSGSDIDGDDLTFHVVSDPANGRLVGNAPNLRYEPSQDYNGDDSFLFRVRDTAGVYSSPVQVFIRVPAVNDAPVATNLSASVDEDTTVQVTLAATDVENDTLSYHIVANPQNGGVECNGRVCVYTPAANFHGNDSFTWKANDELADSNVATVSVRVNSVNDVPVALAQTATTDEDTAVDVTLGGTDADGDDLTYRVSAQPANGVVTGNPPRVRYTPNANFQGTDTFQFLANDGVADSSAGTATITVRAVNDAPTVTTPDDQSDTENDGINLQVSGNDVDGDTLVWTATALPPGLSIHRDTGVISGTLSYTAAANSPYAARATVSDGNASATVQFRWTVANLNRAPAITNPGDQISGEGSTVSIRIASSDPDGEELTHSASGLPPGLAITDAGVISGRIEDGARDDSPYTVTVTVTDGAANASAEFDFVIALPPTVTIDSPTAGWHTTRQGFQASITDLDCEQEPTVTSSPDLGLSVVNVSMGRWVATSTLDDGKYPVTLNVTSTCSALNVSASRNFGIDTADPLIVFARLNQNGVDPQDHDTWPAVGGTDRVPMAALLRDLRSGLANASVRLFNEENDDEWPLYEATFDARDGDPGSGNASMSVALCENRVYCSESGELTVESLDGEFYLIQMELTDVAGRTTAKDFYFRISTLRAAIVAWRDAVASLSSENQNATAALDTALLKLNRSLQGFDEAIFGNMVLGFEDAYAQLLVAQAYDGNITIPDEAAFCGRQATIWMTSRMVESRRLRNDELSRIRFDTSDEFIVDSTRAWDAQDPSSGFLALANATFWMEDGRTPFVADIFPQMRGLTLEMISEMEAYVAVDPPMAGQSEIATALATMQDTVEPLITALDRSPDALTDLQHVTLFLGLTDTALALKEAENETVWVRNWQWGMTQIVLLLAERNVYAVGTFLERTNPLYIDGRRQLDRAIQFREDKKPDDFMTLLIDSRCLVVGIYNLVWDPDVEVPTACCDDIERYNGLDDRVPVPDHCIE
jgi:hypothetical protein